MAKGRNHAHFTIDEVKLLMDNWHDRSKREWVIQTLGRSKSAVTQKFYAVLNELNVDPKEYRKHKGLPPGVSLEGVTARKDSASAISADVEKTLVVDSKAPEAAVQNDSEDVVPRRPIFTVRRRNVEPERTSEHTEPQNVPVVSRGSAVAATYNTSRDQQEVEPEERENLTDLILGYERRLREIETRINGILTIKEFAGMMRDLESAYDTQAELLNEIDKLNRENDKLKSQIRRMERRDRDREEQLGALVDTLNVRLASFMGLPPLEKLQDIGEFQEQMMELISSAQKQLGRRVISA